MLGGGKKGAQIVNPVDIIAALVIVVILSAAIAYIVREKRKGVVCVGCALAKSCAQKSQAAAEGECPCGAVEKMLSDAEDALR